MSESDSNSLAVIEGDEYKFLGEPIQRKIVVQFADTLMGIHPQAKEIGVIGMRTVAQLAMLTGANPLPGTNGIHAWRDNNDKLCIQFGIGFWRGEAEKQGSVMWVIRPRPMDEGEREFYSIANGVLAAICEGALKRDIFSLMADARAFGIKMTIKEAKGEQSRVGIAIAGGGKDWAKVGRPMQWSADERAERDLLRKLVPVLQRARDNAMGGEFKLSGMDWNAAEYVHLTDGKSPEMSPLEKTNSDWFGDSEPIAIETPVTAETEPEAEPAVEQVASLDEAFNGITEQARLAQEEAKQTAIEHTRAAAHKKDCEDCKRSMKSNAYRDEFKMILCQSCFSVRRIGEKTAVGQSAADKEFEELDKLSPRNRESVVKQPEPAADEGHGEWFNDLAECQNLKDFGVTFMEHGKEYGYKNNFNVVGALTNPDLGYNISRNIPGAFVFNSADIPSYIAWLIDRKKAEPQTA